MDAPEVELRVLDVDLMDFSGGDIAVRHAVALGSLTVKHEICVAPEAIPIAKEIRNCVVALAVAWVGVSLVKAVIEYRKHTASQRRTCT